MRIPVNLSHPAEEEGYLASLSDLMVGLLFIFIIILMAFALNYRQAETVSAQEAEKQQLETQLQREETARLQLETLKQQHEQLRLQKETDEHFQEKQRLIQETHFLLQQKELLLQQKVMLEGIIDRLTNNDQVRRNLLQRIQTDLAVRGVRIFIDEKNGILRLPEELLFDSGKAEFRPAGKMAIQQLAGVLMDVLPCYSAVSVAWISVCPKLEGARLEAVFIEGHTDNVPINTREIQDNWSLASLRAQQTFKALIVNAPLLESLQNPQQEPLLSVSAYESRRPVAPNTTEEGKRLNRRIDLRFLMASPPPAMLDEAYERLESSGQGK